MPTATRGRITPAQIAELRRWARGLRAGEDDRLERATRAVVRLADEALRRREPEGGGGWDWSGSAGPTPPTPEQLERIRRFARQAVADGGSDELRAAARAILLLCDDIEAPGEEDGPEPAAAPARARAGGGRARLATSLGRALARWRRVSPLVLLSLLVPLAAFAVVIVLARAAAPELDPRGPADGLVNAAEVAQLTFSIAGDRGTLERAEWTLDGKRVTGGARVAGDRVAFGPGKLGDGRHTLEVSLPGLALWSPGEAAWTFTVDTAPPEIRVTKGSLRAQVRNPYELRGAVTGGGSLTVGGKPVELDGEGRFAVSYDAPPGGAIRLVAADRAGNTATSTLTVKLVPRRPPNPIRGVHVSADGWASDELRAGILALIEQGRINTVQLDLKDESGVIGWDADVPLARKAGAIRDTFDLEAAVKQLHAKGVRVVGRLVAFRDPILSEWAWKQKQRDLVIQTPGGDAYSGGYGGFTNFASDEVRAYNIAVAVAAAELGVDDILYDYVRRPDGPLDSMVFPGLSGSAAESITSFLRESRLALAPTGAFLGASVFGIAATRPEEIGQHVPSIAREVDYVAPMVYPSHWGPYEYGLESPVAQPYEIVKLSLADFRRAVRGTGARVVPWLQDFSLGVDYGPAEVKAQIDGAADAGLDEFLLWDPAVTYTAGALAGGAELPTVGVAKPGQASAELVKLPSTSGTVAPEPARGEPQPATQVEQAAVDSGLQPNELGLVPVLMYHQIVPGGGSEYDLTPDEFRAELGRLYEEHYRPITARDLVSGTIDVPEGTTPVVLTFDDSSASQAGLRDDGTIDPETAVGIMLEFAESHPGFVPAATFYLNGDPFGAGEKTGELLRWLAANGFELANHTRDHTNFSEVSGEEVQRQLVLENRVIREHVPDAKVVTMALPYGVMPDPARLARKGTWEGEPYAFKGVMLVGAEPAPSPYSAAFAAGGIPRIRSALERSVELGSAYWLDTLAESPGLRYVSDGDPDAIAFPESRQGNLASRFADRAKPY
ncbi:MAG: polysaccharide deacetylase family protein [Thermoleophilia bacterium]|nr:polysaccharide deacetylase family protein [Thermoleophilia bacterium]